MVNATDHASDDWTTHLTKIAAVALDMRAAQRAYFRNRTADNLVAARELEKKLDAMLAERTTRKI